MGQSPSLGPSQPLPTTNTHGGEAPPPPHQPFEADLVAQLDQLLLPPPAAASPGVSGPSPSHTPAATSGAAGASPHSSIATYGSAAASNTAGAWSSFGSTTTTTTTSFTSSTSSLLAPPPPASRLLLPPRPTTNSNADELPTLRGLVSDHFAALEEIGRGTFCKVYRASPVSPAAQQMCRGKSVGVRAVALKVIDLHAYEGKPGARERVEAIIESEIKVLGRIANSDKLRNHPNIVRPMGVLREGDRVVVVMEQLRGGELFDRILAKGQHLSLIHI